MTEGANRPAGTRLDLDFSGIGVRIENLDSRFVVRLAEEWAAFVGATDGDPLLRITFATVDRVYDEPDYRPKSMRSRLHDDQANFLMPEGEVAVRRDGEARAELVSGTGDRGYYTAINFIRACLAWLLPSHGGALVHAAAVAVGENGFLLVGAEGSGKSTWVRLAASVGEYVISDDLVLVSGVGTEPRLMGAPFRSTHRADYRPGSWPLAAILFPVHGPEPGWTEVGTMLSRSRLLANLPFVADAPSTDRSVDRLVDGLVAGVPCGEFSFALDPGFVALLRDWAPGG